jgi:hypothetical protein
MDEQHIGRCLLRNSAKGQNQFMLVAHKILKVGTDALCPGGSVVQDCEVEIGSEHLSIDGIVKRHIFWHALQRNRPSCRQKA